jgi:hypothetical protein
MAILHTGLFSNKTVRLAYGLAGLDGSSGFGVWVGGLWVFGGFVGGLVPSSLSSSVGVGVCVGVGVMVGVGVWDGLPRDGTVGVLDGRP